MLRRKALVSGHARRSSSSHLTLLFAHSPSTHILSHTTTRGRCRCGWEVAMSVLIHSHALAAIGKPGVG